MNVEVQELGEILAEELSLKSFSIETQYNTFYYTHDNFKK